MISTASGAATSGTRVKKRIPCTLDQDERHHSGMILNLSHGGVFVQTNLPAEPGSLVDLHFRGPKGDDFEALQAAVVWRKRVSSQMLGTTQSGMGLRFLVAPSHYVEMIEGIGEPSGQASTLDVNVPGREEGTAESAGCSAFGTDGDNERYVVRLAQKGGPRTRRLVLDCSNEEAARTDALERLGPGWTIIEISDD